jgi:hypothetical protein
MMSAERAAMRGMTPEEKRAHNERPISPKIYAMVASWPPPPREVIARVRRLLELDKYPLGMELPEAEPCGGPTQEHTEVAAISEPAAEQSGAGSVSAPPPSEQPATPWMTVSEVATYVGMHPQTIYGALREFESTRGRKGLRGYQRNANSKWRAHREDADAWIRGEKPGRRKTAP